MSCEHEAFAALVEVEGRGTGEERWFSAEVTLQCAQCGARFSWDYSNGAVLDEGHVLLIPVRSGPLRAQ